MPQFTCKKRRGHLHPRKMVKGPRQFLQLGWKENEKKKGYSVVNFHHEGNAACKQEAQKSWAVKGLGPLSHPSPLSLADACGPNACGGGSSENALSPLEGPTVCQGAQGAQWTLVNAFQESGSGERGGEVEGGLALRNAARSWGDSRGTG